MDPSHLAAEHRLLEQADLVVTVSSALTEWVRSQRSGPTLTIGNGYEPRWFRPQHRTPRYPLVFLGHPKPWHGADRLPELLHALAGRGHRPDLLIIGGGPGADDVRERARTLGVHDQIEITGPLAPEQATARLAEARIGLAPYPRQEPFYFCPLKVVDYLAAGLAVVATGQGDVPDLVGNAGHVVTPDDFGYFVDAVETLLIDPQRCRELGLIGQRRAESTMTWNHVAASTAAACYGLVRSSAAVP